VAQECVASPSARASEVLCCQLDHGRVQGMIDGDWGGNGESASIGFMSASR